MSRQAYRDARRMRNRALANHDAKHRCASCRRALPEGYLLVFGAVGSFKFCDEDCRLDFDAAQVSLRDAR